MPFIVQCPHPDCAKYMLLEDVARGARVECLICKRLLQVDASGPGLLSPKSPAARSSPPTVPRHRVAHCPQCNGPMRVPPTHQGKAIQCPHCNHVFVL